MNRVPDPPAKPYPVRTLIGIDATQSMEKSLEDLLNILPNAFARIYDIVK